MCGFINICVRYQAPTVASGSFGVTILRKTAGVKGQTLPSLDLYKMPMLWSSTNTSITWVNNFFLRYGTTNDIWTSHVPLPPIDNNWHIETAVYVQESIALVACPRYLDSVMKLPLAVFNRKTYTWKTSAIEVPKRSGLLS